MKYVDALGFWIGKHLTPVNQVRVGVIMILTSLLFIIYAPFSGEKMGVYIMSFLALFYGGKGFIVTAFLALKEDEEEDIEDLNHG